MKYSAVTDNRNSADYAAAASGVSGPSSELFQGSDQEPDQTTGQWFLVAAKPRSEELATVHL